jgi:adenylate cyclase
MGTDEKRGGGKVGRGMAAAARKLDTHPRLLTAARLAREMLPGDSRFGDELSTAGEAGPEVVGRRVSALTEKRPGVLREAGLSALQLWQAVSESQGRGRGEAELAILFTDLVEFSRWALAAGDDAALDLLRDVGRAIEPPVRERSGRVVKRLGDGMMAVFEDPADAVAAVFDAQERLAEVEADGYDPEMRAGLHVGHPRKLGGDYLGVDVNVAARLAEDAGGGDLLVSDRLLERLDQDGLGLKVKKKRRFGVKGVPKELTAYSVSRQ